MLLFTQHKNQLTNLKEKKIKLERDIKELFETNLGTLTGWQLIKSEFSVKNNRIDTLAYDLEAKAFVIIEYKRDRNYSVIDQGVSYLNLMLEYKADFIVEYNENQDNILKRDDIDWSQSKVIFVAPSFTDFQKQSSNFKDLSIELWEIKQFENNVVLLNPIKKSKSAPSIKPLQKVNNQSELTKVTKEIKVYQEEDLFIRGTEYSLELYEEFKTAILNLDINIEIIPKKEYIAFKKGKNNITDITILKKGVKIWINKKHGQLDDPKNIARDVTSLGHWGNGDYEIFVEKNNDLEYIMSLIKQTI